MMENMAPILTLMLMNAFALTMMVILIVKLIVQDESDSSDRSDKAGE